MQSQNRRLDLLNCLLSGKPSNTLCFDFLRSLLFISLSQKSSCQYFIGEKLSFLSGTMLLKVTLLKKFARRVNLLKLRLAAEETKCVPKRIRKKEKVA